MIHDSINLSKKVASLSPEALSLFCLLIPKFNSHGKMSGDPYSIKGDVCRHVEWLDIKTIKKCLKEISQKTNVKWWEDKDGNGWIHALNFRKYQKLREDRLGHDTFPNFPYASNNEMEHSRTNHGVLQEHSIPEVEVEVEVEEEVEKRSLVAPRKAQSSPDEDFQEFLASLKTNSAYRTIDIDRELAKMDAWFLLPRNQNRKKTKRFVLNWINRIDVSVSEAGGARAGPADFSIQPPSTLKTGNYYENCYEN